MEIFVYLFAPFILQKFKKILRANPNLWGCAIFRSKMTYLSWTIFFWYKPLLSLSSTYWPFYCAKFLKILTADQELWGCAIFGHKMVHLPQTKIFQKIINIVLIYLLALFRKPVNEPCFFYLCLCTCQNSNLAEWNIDD